MKPISGTLRKLCLQEMSSHPGGGLEEMVDAISSAISHQIVTELGQEYIFSNVCTMVAGTIPDEQLVRPARYEDVEHFANKIAAKVTQDIHEQVFSLAREVVHSLMNGG